MTKMARRHIDGGDAARMAIESAKRGPVTIESPPADDAGMPATTTVAPPLVPAGTGSNIPQPTEPRKRPPRVRKPSPGNDQCFAPTADVEGHRAELRQAFGNTFSDEFVSSRTGQPCQQAAVRGRSRCRMPAGLRAPGGLEANATEISSTDCVRMRPKSFMTRCEQKFERSKL